MKKPVRRRVHKNQGFINRPLEHMDDDEESQQEIFQNKAITSDQGLKFKSKKST